MPKIVDHEAIREKVAEAMWRVIAREGIEAATIREIAKEAHCSTGTVQYYFKNKDELILYAFCLASMRMGGRMWNKGEESTGTQILRNVILESLPLDEERRLEWQIWVVFYGRAATNPMMSAEYNQWYIEYRSLIRGLVVDGQRNGYYRADIDAAAEANAIIMLIAGIGTQAILEPRHFTPEFQIELVDRHLSSLPAS
jgi:AcrR family transcriptional regulator